MIHARLIHSDILFPSLSPMLWHPGMRERMINKLYKAEAVKEVLQRVAE
jgi:hypothetical protein